MTLKSKIYFVIFAVLEFAAVLFLLGYLAAGPLQASERRAEAATPAVRAADRRNLKLVSFAPVYSGNEIVGGLAAYDDPESARPTDYMEFYNNGGGLLAVSWFDEFGIQRMAVDRALLEKRDELEGVMVMVSADDPI